MKNNERTKEELIREIARLKNKVAQLEGQAGSLSEDKTETKRVNLDAIIEAGESLELFTDIINLSNDSIFVADAETSRFLYVNDKACSSLGYHRDALLSMGVTDIQTLLTDNFLWETFVKSVKNTGSLILEGRHKRKDGTTFPVEISVKYITKGNKSYMLAMGRDITQRKDAEYALKEERDRFLNILETVQDGIYIVNQQCEIEYINPVVKKEFGNVNGQRCYEYFHGRKNVCPWCKNKEVFEGKTISWEFYFEKKNKMYELFDMPIKKPDGTIVKFEVFHDITSRKAAEESLRQSEEKYRTLVETIPHGIQENDTFGIITFSNAAHCKIQGYTKEEMLGKGIWDFCITEEDKESVRKYLEMIVREQPSPVPFFGKNITKDRRIIDVQIDWNYKRDDKGNLVGFISTITDITERRKAEEAKERLQLQLLHAHKMEAIGRLAGGISHDFGNILTAIKNFSHLGINRTGDSNPAVRDIFEHIVTASFRAINLTKQLISFSQKEFTRIANTNMNKVINDLLHMLNRLIGENITISSELDDGLWTIQADAGKLEQVVTNLVINARDAMSEGGIITIQSKNLLIDEEQFRKIPYARAGRFICLTVKDTGVGISEENLYHIYEPFFTTKKNASSAGLGLSIVYWIIKDHRGWINVSSEKGHGTTFDIYLPAVEAESAGNTEERIEAGKIRSNGERVLLVEDDEMVRTSTRMSLAEEGYIVFEAESAGSALDIFNTEGGEFHLVMSDLVLPDKDGLSLIQELLVLNPGIKAILNSGYIDKPIDRSKLARYGIVFFNKPYEIQDVLVTIRNMLKHS